MTAYVFIKRDLFECPGHMGYTGIRDKAGVWSEEYARKDGAAVRDKYDSKEMNHYAIPLDTAPEFTKTSFHDLNEAHLRSKIASLQADKDNLRATMKEAT